MIHTTDPDKFILSRHQITKILAMRSFKCLEDSTLESGTSNEKKITPIKEMVLQINNFFLQLAKQRCFKTGNLIQENSSPHQCIKMQ